MNVLTIMIGQLKLTGSMVNGVGHVISLLPESSWHVNTTTANSPNGEAQRSWYNAGHFKIWGVLLVWKIKYISFLT